MNPTPATKSEPESVGLWFFVYQMDAGQTQRTAVDFSKNGGISNTYVLLLCEPQHKFVQTQSITYLSKSQRGITKIQDFRRIKPMYDYLLGVLPQSLIGLNWKPRGFEMEASDLIEIEETAINTKIDENHLLFRIEFRIISMHKIIITH